MSAYFVPTRFIWRFGGQVVSVQPEPICSTVLGCKINAKGAHQSGGVEVRGSVAFENRKGEDWHQHLWTYAKALHLAVIALVVS